MLYFCKVFFTCFIRPLKSMNQAETKKFYFNMRKLIVLSVFTLGFLMNLNAQSDGFFTFNNVEENRTATMGDMPAMIGHNSTSNMDAPVGSGLLLLAGMGLAYGIRKKSK